MPNDPAARPTRLAAFLFFLVGTALSVPLGLHIANVIAQVTGGSSPPLVLASPDPISDAVAATSAEFRVDESGAATYTVPIYAVPGTAGVAPKISLNYSSQGSYGALGKGWSIGGLSYITRCRAARETGDFIGASTPDGSPRPINFTASDRFCLDGQRLVPSSETCTAAAGMTVTALATEIDSFRRICAYTANAAVGPAFLTVEGRDGSISWYGDRDSYSSANRLDGYMESNAYGVQGAALFWAQTRFQDSSGGYIDYVYTKNPVAANSGEHVIKEIRYTGKIALSGQSVTLPPYAKLQFNYSTRPATAQSLGYVSNGTVRGSQRLESITACATTGTCAATNQARHILLTYGTSPSGSGQDTLVGIQECRDDTAAVCTAPTSFVWAPGMHAFASSEKPASLTVDTNTYLGHKLADVNGDGRLDLIYLRSGNGACSTNYLTVLLATFDSSSRPTYSASQTLCLPANITSRGKGGWHVFDFNGDGRDDLFVAKANGTPWSLYPSTGTGFNTAQDLIAGHSPAIPSDWPTTMADVNGDGLVDIIYSTKIRVMERKAGGFAWGGERSLQIDTASIPRPVDCDSPDVTCTLGTAFPNHSAADYMQMIDFNGDAASDIVGSVNWELEIWDSTNPNCQQRRMVRSGTPSRGYAELPMDVVVAPMADPCIERRNEKSSVAWVVDALAPTVVGLKYYSSIGTMSPAGLEFGDVNGDGLTDVFYRNFANSEWTMLHNSGKHFQWVPSGVLTTSFKNEVRFVDVTGDGRVDMLYLVDYGSYKGYAVRKALPDGTFAAGTALPGGNARICEGTGCNQAQRISFFADLDGDGNQDFLSMGMGAGLAELYISRSNQRFSPRDVITRVVNGLGNETDISYAPMTFGDVYRRDTGSLNGTNWGRGSPVQDVLTPTYLVTRVDSTSPQHANAAAKASLHYRYAGARMQAGGRGYLGFREITVFDVNQPGGYVASTTTYAQNFPFAGFPLQTSKAAILNQAYLVPTCLNSIVSNSCFTSPGSPFPAVGGSWFSNNIQSWEVAPATLASQAPLHVRTQGTEESVRDPYAATVTSKITTAFGYGSRGNVSQSVVDTYTGGSTLTSTQITSNTYSDDVTRWRLGRLTASTVTHRRPGQSDVVRTAGFGYDMGAAKTGLLTAEHTQPGGAANLASSKIYTLDSFGNRVQETVCAAPTTNCTAAGLPFHPSSPDSVRRYTRVEYDAQGRFPVATYEPFWTPGGGEERRTAYIMDRNIFGDPVSAADVNGVRTIAVKGMMGREYYTFTQTTQFLELPNGGITTRMTYRWCSGANSVPCPAGARYRLQEVASAAPRKWSYFDALGRPMMVATESFNVGVSGQDVSAVCTAYDAAGRPQRVSNPFFLTGTGGTDGPADVGTVCSAPERLWTVTSYDILGRATAVVMPDGGQLLSSYAGLTTTVRDQRNNSTTQLRNGRGELVSVTDASGLQTTYAYNAAGQIRSVSRDAGAGAIVNSFTHDVLGRKTQQVDPDTGTSTFQYNALGEQIAQIDNGGYRIDQEFDARGRVWRKTAKLPNGNMESQSTFEFDDGMGASGQLVRETITGTYGAWTGQTGMGLQLSREFHFDNLGRSVSTTTTVDGRTYGTGTAYDILSRPWQTRDASGLYQKTQYGPRGVVAICDSTFGDTDPNCPAGSATFQRTLATDAWGNTTREKRGDSAAMEIRRLYHGQNGRIAEICAGTSSCGLVKEAYAWDLAGNLSTHQKESRYLETFTYDNLNRMTEARLSMVNGVNVNQVTLANAYDVLGNLCSKNSVGYGYPGADGCAGTQGLTGAGTTIRPLTDYLEPQNQWQASADQPEQGATTSEIAGASPGGPVTLLGAITGSPHAVSQTGNGTAASFYYYDDRGNQTQRDAPGTATDRVIRYTADGMAHEIQMGNGQRVSFWYGPDGQRYKKEEAGKVTLYVGGVEVILQGTAETIRRYVAGVALQVVVNGVVQSTKYLFHDHLGSLVRLANPNGTLAEGLDFTAFGERRAYGDPNGAGTPSTNTSRGFTGHELVDGTDVIHMNGRIYDSRLGRFLQPDPVVQAPENSQSWNAYAYAFNNPLTFTDPSGLFNLGRFLRIVIAIVITVYTGGAAAGYWSFFGASITAGSLAAYGVVALGGFASGAIMTGTLKGGLIGAFSAVAFYGVGQYANAIRATDTARMGMHAVTGGIVETLQGGNFGQGFVSAGLSKLTMSNIDTGHLSADVALAAMAGGTISELTGGKFSNGAVTSAMQFALNQMGQRIAMRNASNRALILVGDAGLGNRNVGTAFIDAANTAAERIRAAGGEVEIVRVSSIDDILAALNTGSPVGAVYYYGHSSYNALHPGENPGDRTNVDFNNARELRAGRLVAGAAVYLYSCNAGYPGYPNIADHLAWYMDRPAYGFQSSLHFSNDPAFKPVGTGFAPWTPAKPVYMRPDDGQRPIRYEPRSNRP